MRRAVIRRSSAIAVVLAALLALVGGQAALALDEPTVPEPVATYFASALIPRLADLYGPGKKAGSGIDFDATSKVGDIHRVFSWTADYLAGKKTDDPIELTNNWVASVSVKDQVVGLATIWINPNSDDPELANFDLGPGLVTALAAAPKDTVLVRDDTHEAWFATDGAKLYPLVSGASGVATQTTVGAFQKSFPAVAPTAPVSSAATNEGLIIAGIVLAAVVILLAVFVLLPDRRKRNAARPAEEPAPELPLPKTPTPEDPLPEDPLPEDPNPEDDEPLAKPAD